MTKFNFQISEFVAGNAPKVALWGLGQVHFQLPPYHLSMMANATREPAKPNARLNTTANTYTSM